MDKRMTNTQKREKMSVQVDNVCMECGKECHCAEETGCPSCECIEKAMDRDGPA